MRGDFQKLLVSQDGAPAVLSLNVQAAMGPVREPERSQFVLLMRHFLERFFNHETASPDGDGKKLLVQLAFGAGIPGFMVALYLWPVYHPVIVWPPHPDMHSGSTALLGAVESSFLLRAVFVCGHGPDYGV